MLVSGLTLKALEDVFLRYFLGFTWEQAIGVLCIEDFYGDSNCHWTVIFQATNFTFIGMPGLEWCNKAFENLFYYPTVCGIKSGTTKNVRI